MSSDLNKLDVVDELVSLSLLAIWEPAVIARTPADNFSGRSWLDTERSRESTVRSCSSRSRRASGRSGPRTKPTTRTTSPTPMRTTETCLHHARRRAPGHLRSFCSTFRNNVVGACARLRLLSNSVEWVTSLHVV